MTYIFDFDEHEQYFLNPYFINKMLPWCEASMMVPQSDLYEKNDDRHFLSMVSPEQWGRSKKFKRFVATVKLLADHTWDVLKMGEEEV